MTPTELHTWRTEANLSLEGLASQLGVNRMTIFRWEKGQRSIPAYLHLALKALTPPSPAIR